MTSKDRGSSTLWRLRPPTISALHGALLATWGLPEYHPPAVTSSIAASTSSDKKKAKRDYFHAPPEAIRFQIEWKSPTSVETRTAEIRGTQRWFLLPLEWLGEYVVVRLSFRFTEPVALPDGLRTTPNLIYFGERQTVWAGRPLTAPLLAPVRPVLPFATAASTETEVVTGQHHPDGLKKAVSNECEDGASMTPAATSTSLASGAANAAATTPTTPNHHQHRQPQHLHAPVTLDSVPRRNYGPEAVGADTARHTGAAILGFRESLRAHPALLHAHSLASSRRQCGLQQVLRGPDVAAATSSALGDSDNSADGDVALEATCNDAATRGGSNDYSTPKRSDDFLQFGTRVSVEGIATPTSPVEAKSANANGATDDAPAGVVGQIYHGVGRWRSIFLDVYEIEYDAGSAACDFAPIDWGFFAPGAHLCTSPPVLSPHMHHQGAERARTQSATAGSAFPNDATTVDSAAISTALATSETESTARTRVVFLVAHPHLTSHSLFASRKHADRPSQVDIERALQIEWFTGPGSERRLVVVCGALRCGAAAVRAAREMLCLCRGDAETPNTLGTHALPRILCVTFASAVPRLTFAGLGATTVAGSGTVPPSATAQGGGTIAAVGVPPAGSASAAAKVYGTPGDTEAVFMARCSTHFLHVAPILSGWDGADVAMLDTPIAGGDAAAGAVSSGDVSASTATAAADAGASGVPGDGGRAAAGGTGGRKLELQPSDFFFGATLQFAIDDDDIDGAQNVTLVTEAAKERQCVFDATALLGGFATEAAAAATGGAFPRAPELATDAPFEGAAAAAASGAASDGQRAAAAVSGAGADAPAASAGSAGSGAVGGVASTPFGRPQEVALKLAQRASPAVTLTPEARKAAATEAAAALQSPLLTLAAVDIVAAPVVTSFDVGALVAEAAQVASPTAEAGAPNPALGLLSAAGSGAGGIAGTMAAANGATPSAAAIAAATAAAAEARGVFTANRFVDAFDAQLSLHLAASLHCETLADAQWRCEPLISSVTVRPTRSSGLSVIMHGCNLQYPRHVLLRSNGHRSSSAPPATEFAAAGGPAATPFDGRGGSSASAGCVDGRDAAAGSLCAAVEVEVPVRDGTQHMGGFVCNLHPVLLLRFIDGRSVDTGMVHFDVCVVAENGYAVSLDVTAPLSPTLAVWVPVLRGSAASQPAYSAAPDELLWSMIGLDAWGRAASNFIAADAAATPAAAATTSRGGASRAPPEAPAASVPRKILLGLEASICAVDEVITKPSQGAIASFFRTIQRASPTDPLTHKNALGVPATMKLHAVAELLDARLRAPTSPTFVPAPGSTSAAGPTARAAATNTTGMSKSLVARFLLALPWLANTNDYMARLMRLCFLFEVPIPLAPAEVAPSLAAADDVRHQRQSRMGSELDDGHRTTMTASSSGAAQPQREQFALDPAAVFSPACVAAAMHRQVVAALIASGGMPVNANGFIAEISLKDFHEHMTLHLLHRDYYSTRTAAEAEALFMDVVALYTLCLVHEARAMCLFTTLVAATGEPGSGARTLLSAVRAAHVAATKSPVSGGGTGGASTSIPPSSVDTRSIAPSSPATDRRNAAFTATAASSPTSRSSASPFGATTLHSGTGSVVSNPFRRVWFVRLRPSADVISEALANLSSVAMFFVEDSRRVKSGAVMDVTPLHTLTATTAIILKSRQQQALVPAPGRGGATATPFARTASAASGDRAGEPGDVQQGDGLLNAPRGKAQRQWLVMTKIDLLPDAKSMQPNGVAAAAAATSMMTTADAKRALHVLAAADAERSVERLRSGAINPCLSEWAAGDTALATGFPLSAIKAALGPSSSASSGSSGVSALGEGALALQDVSSQAVLGAVNEVISAYWGS